MISFLKNKKIANFRSKNPTLRNATTRHNISILNRLFVDNKKKITPPNIMARNFKNRKVLSGFILKTI